MTVHEVGILFATCERPIDLDRNLITREPLVNYRNTHNINLLCPITEVLTRAFTSANLKCFWCTFSDELLCPSAVIGVAGFYQAVPYACPGIHAHEFQPFVTELRHQHTKNDDQGEEDSEILQCGSHAAKASASDA